MIELRGIALENHGATTTTKLFTKDTATGAYKVLILPQGIPVNKGQIINFIGKAYKIPPGEVSWVGYVVIPKL